MAEIKSISKNVERDLIRFMIETQDGEIYQVIHLVRKDKILERIYFIGTNTIKNSKLPPCISRREFSAHRMPNPNFKQIIEGHLKN